MDSVTEHLMDAVKHALSSSEHIVDLGETNNLCGKRKSGILRPSPGATADAEANGVCRIPVGNRLGQKGPAQLLEPWAPVAELGVVVPAAPSPCDLPRAP